MNYNIFKEGDIVILRELLNEDTGVPGFIGTVTKHNKHNYVTLTPSIIGYNFYAPSLSKLNKMPIQLQYTPNNYTLLKGFRLELKWYHRFDLINCVSEPIFNTKNLSIKLLK